jgi:hypothetical protein
LKIVILETRAMPVTISGTITNITDDRRIFIGATNTFKVTDLRWTDSSTTSSPALITGASALFSLYEDYPVNDESWLVTPNISDVFTPATSGDFVLMYDEERTAALSYLADKDSVQTALEGLSNIGSSNVVVSGGPMSSASMTVQFDGTLGNRALSEALSAYSVSLFSGSDSVDMTFAETPGKGDVVTGADQLTMNDEGSGVYRVDVPVLTLTVDKYYQILMEFAKGGIETEFVEKVKASRYPGATRPS